MVNNQPYYFRGPLKPTNRNASLPVQNSLRVGPSTVPNDPIRSLKIFVVGLWLRSERTCFKHKDSFSFSSNSLSLQFSSTSDLSVTLDSSLAFFPFYVGLCTYCIIPYSRRLSGHQNSRWLCFIFHSYYGSR